MKQDKIKSHKKIEEFEIYNWNQWKPFPNPQNGDYLNAPFGKGVYQLRNKVTYEYILFGKGKHCSYRMSSLLPSPYGCGTRNNEEKRKYILDNLEHIEYRTVAFLTKQEMQICEGVLKNKSVHLFNT